MQPPRVIPYYADSAHRGGPWDKPRCIVLHHTGGTNSLQWLSRTPNSGVSIHVLAPKDGTLYRIVPDGVQAWHVGRSAVGNYGRSGSAGSPNECCLGIEIENMGNGRDPYPQVQLSAVGWQICQWWNAYGDLPVITHELIDTTGKVDPYGVSILDIVRYALAHYDH